MIIGKPAVLTIDEEPGFLSGKIGEVEGLG